VVHVVEAAALAAAPGAVDLVVALAAVALAVAPEAVDLVVAEIEGEGEGAILRWAIMVKV
jgi:hypothetical protein